MVSRKRIFWLAILVTSIIGFRIYIFPFIPISTDKSEYTIDYELRNAFPLLSFNEIVDLQNSGSTSIFLYVAEQNGIIYRFINDNETNEKTIFLDISSEVLSGGELGLLGFAFHPNFLANSYFFVDYTTDDPRRTRISRFSVDANGLANRSSELIILEVEQPYSNHNAGAIAFGPDGYLYITLGDGGLAGDPQNNGQDLNTLLGSILRIDIDQTEGELNYLIPEDNPFINTPNTRGEIWAYGLRNPWRISFDPLTSNLFAGDVGQNKYEEINLIEKGGNYGWNIMEGFHCFKSNNCDKEGLILPLVEYDHQLGFSVTGGYVYRGTQENGLYGKYIYADFGSGRFWYFNVSDLENINVVDFLKINESFSSFGVDQNGELYVLGYSGTIYDIVERKQTITTG